MVVGLGSIGRRHARLLNERADLAVEFVEPNPDILALAIKEVGDLPCHASFAQMLKTTPQMVLIATPHSLHKSQTIAALQADCHVFCEKPISDNLADAQKMRDAADRTGRVLNIGFQLHFHPGLQLLRKTIDSGALGQVLHAHAHVGTYITLVNSLSRYQATAAGALLFDYAHQPDILYWLLRKKPASVYACAIQAGDLQFSSPPNIVDVTCRYTADLVTTIHLNYVQMPERHHYEIVGDRGWAVLDVNAGQLTVGNRQNQTAKTETFSVARDDIYRAEHQAFLDAVAGRRKPETSAADGLISLAICHAAVQSYQSNQPEELTI